MRSTFVLATCLLVGCGPLTPPAVDAGSGDAGALDAGPTDAGAVDAGNPDAGGDDAGADDAGADDAGTSDAGSTDAGAPDAGLDAGLADSGVDAGQAPDAGPCDGGFCPPERITAERIDPWDLAVDGTAVYWLEYGLNTGGLDGELMRQPKGTTCLKRDAGCAQDLNQDFYGRFRVDSMTVAGDDLCWTEYYADQRDVVCQSLTTNGERYLARNQKQATRPTAANGELWWVNVGTSAATGDGQVMRKSLAAPSATAPTAMASLRPAPTSVAVLSDDFAWTEAGATVDAGAVLTAPLDGGPAVLIASGQRTPLSLTRCGPAGELVWVNYRDNTVMKSTLTPDSGVVLASGQLGPFQVVCDDEYVYWLNAGVSSTGADGELWQARLDGSGAAPMVRGIPLAWALAVDGTYVYYIAQGTVTRLQGELWRITKRR